MPMNQLMLAIFACGILPSTAVDFDVDVIPILTKAGCNAAACHGSAAGRGGFKLSLFGGDPTWDHAEITHQLEGRRINLSKPEDSLLIAKPTMQLDHEGGMRFDYDAPQAVTLQKWIQQGARRINSRHVTHLDVEPRDIVLPGIGGQLQIKVTAIFDDGTRRDVTAAAVYDSPDAAAVAVNEDGACQARRRGRHTVIVRYLTQVKTVQITVPLSDTPVDHADLPRQNWIDEEIFATLETLRLPVSRAANRSTMLRRLSLDLTGRLPTVSQVQAYLGDQTTGDYAAFVDALLESDEFVEYWTYKLAKLLRVQTQPNDTAGARAFHDWIRAQLLEDAHWDEMAAELLVAEGDSHRYGPANFYRVVGDPRAQAEYVSELLLGVRLRCANCHNHPLDRWTQNDYHGLAAIFARIERGRTVRLRQRGEVIHPRTGEAAIPRIPGDRFLDPDVDGRQLLAEWLTSNENAYFSKAIVNRLWKAMLGRGLIEPTDDVRATNPATHPTLLARLAQDFEVHGFDLRHTIRLIANSATYQRDNRANGMNRVDDRFYSHALIRPLEPEVLADALCDVTAVAEQYGQQELGTRAVALFNPSTKSSSLDVLGRCSRQASCEASDTVASGLTTQLHLINGPLINEKLRADAGRLTRLVKAGLSTDKIVEQFYLSALARYPTERESEFWQGQLPDQAPDRTARLEDFVWSLLNSREFMTK